MCQVETVEEIACPLPKPGSKRVLRCLHFLERALEIVPLHVYDRYIRLRCSLEVHALRGETQAAAECMVFASARPQDLRAEGSHFLRLTWRQGECKSKCCTGLHLLSDFPSYREHKEI